MDAPLVDRLRLDGERLHEALGREHLQVGAGLSETSAFAALYDRFAWLAEPSTFQEIRGRQALETDPVRRQGVGRLIEWVAQNIESAASRELTDERTTEEAGLTVVVRGEIIHYHDLPGRIRNAADRQMRAELAQALEGAWRSLAPRAADVLARGREAITRLGLTPSGGVHPVGWTAAAPHPGDYAAAHGALAGFDLASLGAQAEELLVRTEDLFRENVGDSLRRITSRVGSGTLAQSLARASLHDLWYVFRLRSHDQHFPRHELASRAAEFLTRMGIDPRASGRIRLDLEDRPGKSARAFCVPIRVPDEIVLVIRPTGGLADTRAFLHESGHALHRAHTDRTLPFEDRALGDASVSETHAMTLERLAGNRLWLRRFVGLSRAATEMPARELATYTLFVARRQAALLCYALELHGGAPEPRDRYRAWLSRASGVVVSPDRWVADVDPAFYCARYLRAFMLEASLSAALRERFDEDWFQNPRAGTFLLGLYADGQRRTAEQIASEHLGVTLDVTPLVRSFEEQLA